jgi:hypothetical protein
MLAPCIPYLLGFPAGAFYMISTGNSFSNEEALPIAYILGVVLYVIVAASLYGFMTSSFDRLAGRCGEFAEGE